MSCQKSLGAPFALSHPSPLPPPFQWYRNTQGGELHLICSYESLHWKNPAVCTCGVYLGRWISASPFFCVHVLWKTSKCFVPLWGYLCSVLGFQWLLYFCAIICTHAESAEGELLRLVKHSAQGYKNLLVFPMLYRNDCKMSNCTLAQWFPWGQLAADGSVCSWSNFMEIGYTL